MGTAGDMSMRCVLLALLTLAAAQPEGPGRISAYVGIPPQADCCFNDTVVDHGQVVFNLPGKCLQLVCNYGKILPRFLGDPGRSHCCEFDGLLYAEGAELAGHCVVMQCTRKGWMPRGDIDDCCKHCSVHDDPHFFTFDGYRYDWHGYCNYSVAQTDRTYNPEAGVFSDFEPCFGGPSCLGRSTFKDQKHTVISLGHSVFNLLVNGDHYTVPLVGAEPVRCSSKVHPVLAWRNGQCTMLLGSSKLMVQHCRYRLDVWAHPTHADNLDGLCGHFNFYDADDFTSRQGDVHPLEYLPSTFPHSWRTLDQTDYKCRQCKSCPPPRVDRLCRADERQLAKYMRMCEEYLGSVIDQTEGLEGYLETCVFDICMMYQDSRNDREVQDWLGILQININMAYMIITLRLGEFELPPSTPLPTSLLNVTVESCKCVVTIRPAVSTMAQQAPRLKEILEDLHEAVKKYGPLESLTIISSRSASRKLRRLLRLLRKIANAVESVWKWVKDLFRPHRPRSMDVVDLCPIVILQQTNKDIIDAAEELLKIRAEMDTDDQTMLEVKLDIEETLKVAGDALVLVTTVDVEMKQIPC